MCVLQKYLVLTDEMYLSKSHLCDLIDNIKAYLEKVNCSTCVLVEFELTFGELV